MCRFFQAVAENWSKNEKKRKNLSTICSDHPETHTHTHTAALLSGGLFFIFFTVLSIEASHVLTPGRSSAVQPQPGAVGHQASPPERLTLRSIKLPSGLVLKPRNRGRLTERGAAAAAAAVNRFLFCVCVCVWTDYRKKKWCNKVWNTFVKPLRRSTKHTTSPWLQ